MLLRLKLTLEKRLVIERECAKPRSRREGRFVLGTKPPMLPLFLEAMFAFATFAMEGHAYALPLIRPGKGRSVKSSNMPFEHERLPTSYICHADRRVTTSRHIGLDYRRSPAYVAGCREGASEKAKRLIERERSVAHVTVSLVHCLSSRPCGPPPAAPDNAQFVSQAVALALDRGLLR